MHTRRVLIALSLAIAVGACSSDGGSGGSSAGSGSTTTAAAPSATTGGATTTTAASAPPSSAAPTTPATVSPSTPPSVVPTVPPTVAPAPTSPPVTAAPCRNVAEVPVGVATTDPPVVDIRRGDCGPGVRQIQDYLVAKGFTIAVDGAFGRNTETAVRNFQASVGLPVDGIVGTWTFIALTSDDYDPSEA